MRACFLLCSVVISSVFGQGCGPNEQFQLCGTACPKTCSNPNPTCIGICVMGCFCSGDRVRNEETGECVEQSECPDPLCKENEEFKLCETCYRSCDNPTPSCSDQCERGCFCKEDLMRDRDGRCVKLEECSGKNDSVKLNASCGSHKVFQECRRCEKSCSHLSPPCVGPCRAGCFCEEGYVKHPNGDCVKPEDCPKEVTQIGVNEPSVEDCGSDEEFLWCGWCEPSCSEPAPLCPAGVCTRGCLCRPPLLRHYSGHCVHERDCLPQSCADPSEEYVCRYGCEPRCDGRACAERSRRCALGCHCRPGLRRHASGRCVPAHQCALHLPRRPRRGSGNPSATLTATTLAEDYAGNTSVTLTATTLAKH